MVKPELEESHVGFDLRHILSSIEEFYLAPIHPPTGHLFGHSIGIRAGYITSCP
jgi:hypothetical protein